MGLEQFLDPKQPQTGLQAYAAKYIEENDELKRMYELNPTDFSYRVNRILDDLVERYGKLLDNRTLRELTTVASGAKEVIDRSTLNKKEIKTVKGKLLISLLPIIPGLYSVYRNTVNTTRDKKAAALEVMKDIIDNTVPFGEELTEKGGYVLERFFGGTPMQRHIRYNLVKALNEEFGIDSATARFNDRSRKYSGVGNRSKNIISPSVAIV